MVEAKHRQIEVVLPTLFLQVDVLLVEAPHRVQIHVGVVFGLCPFEGLCVHIARAEVAFEAGHDERGGPIVGVGHFEMDVDLVAVQVGGDVDIVDVSVLVVILKYPGVLRLRR